MFDAVLLEFLLAPLHILSFDISIFTLSLFAFLVLLMLFHLTISVEYSLWQLFRCASIS